MSSFTTYEEVKNQTTEEYFNGNQFSIDAFNRKYKLNTEETYVKSLKRVCDSIASVEDTEEKRKYWSERWFDEIYNDWWHPAGSIMQGAGSNRNISLANCTHISLGVTDDLNNWDNLESIVRNTAYTVAKCAAYRQGLGVEFSKLRPKKTSVYNSANESTGSIHWMKFIDSLGYYVGQFGRRPAFLFSLSCSHPDIEEFITCKSDYTKIQNANISVQCTDAFYEAVENNSDWELFFEIPEVKKGQKVYVDVHSRDKDTLQDNKGYYYLARTSRPHEKISHIVKARKILELIAKHMTLNAEPGIQNIDIARRYSNSDYVYDEKDEYSSKIIGTNACSEQYLSRDSLCVLASANAGKFSTNPEEYKLQLEKIGTSVNRFLDNVNEYELKNGTYATPHQKLAIQKLRRTGAGYANLVEWLLKQNLGYGTKDGNIAVEEFTKWYNYYLYKSSINLGKEKGSFGLFNRKKLEKSPFIQRLIELGLEFTHLRNVTCSSIAPTGSLLLMFSYLCLSYGIEPAFDLYFWKRTRISGKYEYYFCVPRIVRDLFKAKGINLPIQSDTIKDTWDGKYGRPVVEIIEQHRKLISSNFRKATDVPPIEKLDLMAKVMKWIDSSISVTYLLPENANWKDVYDFILEANKREVKSIAAFPDKKMYGIVSFVPFKDLAFKLTEEGVSIHDQNFTDEELKELNVSRENINIQNNAPKRLKSLKCDLHYITHNNENYLVVVGIQNGVPYEVFGGHIRSNSKLLQDKPKQGTITRNGQGNYSLELADIKIEHFNTTFTPFEQTIFRLSSTMMRHGVPIQYIVEQLGKAAKDVHSIESIIARVLKKYIKDGQKISGKECPSCKSTDLVYQEGCVTCSKCNWSKCS